MHKPEKQNTNAIYDVLWLTKKKLIQQFLLNLTHKNEFLSFFLLYNRRYKSKINLIKMYACI